MIVFVLINAVIWELYTKQILTRQNSVKITGDMSRMGYLPQFNHVRENKLNLNKKHINILGYENQKIDMITIGDSFSNGMSGGINRFYQDYIATYLNMNVLNIQEIPKSRNYIETLIMLINSDSFKKIKPKYILIESTQRKVVNRLSIPVDYNLKASNEDLNKVIKKVDSKNILTLPDIFFINNGNFNI
jgi:23S rRNA pseudoU1915 N3-methylase RlmH